jgi:hypothetical protein
MLLAAGPAIFLVAACSDSIDGPKTSENQVAVTSVTPPEACADVDGDSSGVIFNVLQTFNLTSRTRGSTDQGSVWSDVVFDHVDIGYAMNDALPAPAARVNQAISPATVKVNGTTLFPLTTVLAADIGPGAPLSTAGRSGTISVRFRGQDIAGNPMTATAAVPLATANSCRVGS